MIQHIFNEWILCISYEITPLSKTVMNPAFLSLYNLIVATLQTFKEETFGWVVWSVEDS